jgi:hypothetical protein
MPVERSMASTQAWLGAHQFVASPASDFSMVLQDVPVCKPVRGAHLFRVQVDRALTRQGRQFRTSTGIMDQVRQAIAQRAGVGWRDEEGGAIPQFAQALDVPQDQGASGQRRFQDRQTKGLVTGRRGRGIERVAAACWYHWDRINPRQPGLAMANAEPRQREQKGSWPRPKDGRRSKSTVPWYRAERVADRGRCK